MFIHEQGTKRKKNSSTNKKKKKRKRESSYQKHVISLFLFFYHFLMSCDIYNLNMMLNRKVPMFFVSKGEAAVSFFSNFDRWANI